ncbi:MAG: Fe2+-dependent dioxygenase [Verrucomicrobiaceae bacterium]|nr:MAG: Fe2+-dependent dioxygenase [Verrucomicrobiaceae bacterium]
MIVLPDVLTPEELAYVREELQTASFEDGKLTAHGSAKNVKNNLQIQRSQDSATELDAVLMQALTRHPLLLAWAVPRTVSMPLINRYSKGMHYGFHVDAAVTAQNSQMRRDLSVTLFLSDPETYVGGELEVESPGGLKRIKLPAGSAFIYATHALHQVREVTSGMREAAVFWLQSLIQDDAMRLTLFDLQASMAALVEKGVEGPEMLVLNKVHQNLTRRFSQP